jgi:type II secretion system protein H
MAWKGEKERTRMWSAGKMSHDDHGSRGFSLIELIVVLVIVSLLTALATPSLTKTLQRMELKTASKKISAILRFCRSESVNKNRITLASFDTEAHLVSILSAELGEEKSTLERSYPIPQDVEVGKIEVGKTLMETSHPSFEFYPNGGSNGGSAVIRREQGGAFFIQVDFLTGAVKLEDAK